MSDSLLAAAEAWLDEHSELATQLSDAIHGFAEPGLREYRSAAALTDFLRQHGYEVKTGVAGMPTAFEARSKSDGGPTIGLMCEYDATPGDSQHPVPRPAPIDPDRCGFPDLHNGIGAASVGAAAAIVHALNETGTRASIRVFGTPAEKICVGKPFLARDGYFDGVDAFVAWHPRPYTTVELDDGPGAYEADIFDFEGVSAYGATPWSGVSALDAVTLMSVNVQFMREHFPRQHLLTINDLVTIGGQHPTSLPPNAQVWYVMRSPTLTGIGVASDAVERAADAACRVLGAKYTRRKIAATRPWLPNHAMANTCYAAMKRLGAPSFSEDAKQFGREILRELELPDDQQPFDEQLSPPEARVTRDRAGGTDDVSEFCWHAPTARIYVSHGPRVGRLPNWVGAALSATKASHTTVRYAARAVAASVLSIIADPRALANAKIEFEERLANVGRLSPLLDPEVSPPIHESFAPHYPPTWRPPAGRSASDE